MCIGQDGELTFACEHRGVFFFIGGPCQFFAGILEFFVGNTFPFVVFTTYGGVFLALAATLQPFYNSAGAYSATGSFADGLKTPGFNASLGKSLLLVWHLLALQFVSVTGTCR